MATRVNVEESQRYCSSTNTERKAIRKKSEHSYHGKFPFRPRKTPNTHLQTRGKGQKITLFLSYSLQLQLKHLKETLKLACKHNPGMFLVVEKKVLFQGTLHLIFAVH